MKSVAYLTGLLLIGSLATLSAKSRSVYFIGNSYTYTNSMPDMFVSFAAAMGDTVTYAMSAPGGYTLEQHTTNATTRAGIASQPWDIVVVQEQSQKPSFSPAQVADEVFPFATRLDSLIRDNDSCTQTMFMMTWGRRNGDAMNCASYPPVCTYAGMQGRLRDSYLQMAVDNDADVAPMGAAFKVIIDSFPMIDLYQADSSHPSLTSSYLQACILYTSIFHRSAQGCTYLGGVPATTAQTLQRIADKVVLDSLSQWQQHGHYPFANYSYSHTGATSITFSNGSARATGYTWSFGDGATDTASNPVHSYTVPGVYTVTLTAHTDCFTATAQDTVHIGTPTSILTQVSGLESGVRVYCEQGGNVKFELPSENSAKMLEIYNLSGQLVHKYQVTSHSVSDRFPQGMYLYRLLFSGRVSYGKFVSY